MTDSTEIIARFVSCIKAGRLDLLAADIEAHAQDDTAAADVLSVCAYAAALEERHVFAATVATRAYAARDGASFEDGAVLASALADDRRFSSAVDLLRGTITLRESATELLPMVVQSRLNTLIRAAAEADMPVFDSTTGRLLMPEDVRNDATEQVREELSECAARTMGTPLAAPMARMLVQLGERCGNRTGNWGHVFATIARTIDAEVEGAEGLLLEAQ